MVELQEKIDLYIQSFLEVAEEDSSAKGGGGGMGGWVHNPFERKSEDMQTGRMI
jgi:hypothetical protein